MRYLNQLEPDALVEQFQAHPPQGFVLAPADAPAFVAPFDLLTTAEETLRARVAALPGYRRWSRLLRWRTAFVGTTVSEYALFDPAEDPHQLPTRLAAQLGRRQRLLVIKDVPQDSPLLDLRAAAWNQAFLGACTRAGYLVMEGQALAYVPIDFADEEDYLARLSASRRKDLRRKLRRRQDLTVQTLHCGDACFDAEALVDQYYALYEQVYAQSELHFDKLQRNFFAGLLRDGRSGGVVFAYYDDGELVGWNLCFVAGGKLIDKYIGFAYPAAREFNLYFTSWFHNLAYAKAQGLSHYVAGWTDPAVKAALGARFTLTRHAIYLRNPLLRALARRLSRHFESDSQWA